MPFRPEPALPVDASVRTAVLLCNLGTPDEPTAPALRRYLAEFLSDPRVVELPAALWKPILYGAILPTRPAKSAAKYASVWTPEGSPLQVWTTKQATLLRGFLGERGHRVTVRHAMRYGNPSIPQVLDELKAAGHGRILILPLYPQYSGTTTASVFDAVYAWGQQVRSLPELRFVNRYPDHAGYIRALAHSISTHWQHFGRPDKLVMSFHGVPARTRTLGDPYFDECQQTAHLLVQQLNIRPEQYQLTFQSRFGKAEWLQPYTQPTVEALGKSGVKRIDVVCPGFTSDCLETLEEINMEVREAFLHAGGKEFYYIPCLNDNLDWIRALTDIAEQHLGGWPTRVGS